MFVCVTLDGRLEKALAPKQHAAVAVAPVFSLQVKGKPLSAATIRTGPDYIEVPFVATHENKRGRGFGRCVVEAVEEIARALGIKKLLLCSTREDSVSNTWKHLGFKETSEEQLSAWDVEDGDLVHMQNTLQVGQARSAAAAAATLAVCRQDCCCVHEMSAVRGCLVCAGVSGFQHVCWPCKQHRGSGLTRPKQAGVPLPCNSLSCLHPHFSPTPQVNCMRLLVQHLASHTTQVGSGDLGASEAWYCFNELHALLPGPATALQMHKEVPPPRAWRPIIIRHQAFVARVYMPADKQALSGKSQAARPGRHDMGAISGYKSSMATSMVTNGSLSNASYGGGEDGEEQQVQQGHPGRLALANGGTSRRQEEHPQQQQVQEEQQQQQQEAEQQPVEDDVMLIDQPNQLEEQPQYLLGGAGLGSGSDSLLLMGQGNGSADAMLLPRLRDQQQPAAEQQPGSMETG